jgi:hypothetical protein
VEGEEKAKAILIVYYREILLELYGGTLVPDVP